MNRVSSIDMVVLSAEDKLIRDPKDQDTAEVVVVDGVQYDKRMDDVLREVDEVLEEIIFHKGSPRPPRYI